MFPICRRANRHVEYKNQIAPAPPARQAACRRYFEQAGPAAQGQDHRCFAAKVTTYLTHVNE